MRCFFTDKKRNLLLKNCLFIIRKIIRLALFFVGNGMKFSKIFLIYAKNHFEGNFNPELSKTS